jgi:hypothetical protein
MFSVRRTVGMSELKIKNAKLKMQNDRSSCHALPHTTVRRGRRDVAHETLEKSSTRAVAPAAGVSQSKIKNPKSKIRLECPR